MRAVRWVNFQSKSFRRKQGRCYRAQTLPSLANWRPGLRWILGKIVLSHLSFYFLCVLLTYPSIQCNSEYRILLLHYPSFIICIIFVYAFDFYLLTRLRQPLWLLLHRTYTFELQKAKTLIIFFYYKQKGVFSTQIQALICHVCPSQYSYEVAPRSDSEASGSEFEEEVSILIFLPLKS